MAVLPYAYGLNAYGQGRYGGDHPVVLIPSVERRGIPYITGNDRYQIVCCTDTGTTGSPPLFRYWYAGPPMWDEALTHDPALPPFFALTESNAAPLGSLETSFEPVHLYRSTVVHDATLDGLIVEFIPMPASIESISATVGFTAHIEGITFAGYTHEQGSTVSGLTVSNSFTFSETVTLQAGDPWPNVRSVFCPLRMDIRVSKARAVLTDISLCEITTVRLLGTVEESRTV